MDVKIFRNIANISRVKILACLGESDKTVTELIAHCTLSQSAVSQHLSYLKRYGLIHSTRHGKYQVYKISDKRLAELCKQILKIFPDVN